MELKHWLYFGLGSLATIPFGMRTLLQWFLSEYKKKSYVSVSFWTLSAIGNIFLLVHYMIQVQFHLFVIRCFPLYFGFRQIAMMKNKARPFSWSRFSLQLSTVILALVLLFMLRVKLQYKELRWIFVPQMPWQTKAQHVSYLWHFIGFLGASLFSARLLIQWWQSEQAQKSYFSASFWWISLAGASITLFYAIYIQDIVTALGYSFSLIPYARNLMLLKRESKEQQRAQS